VDASFQAMLAASWMPGVHALATGRAVHVRGVAGEEDPPVPVRRHLGVVDLEGRQPVRPGDREDATGPLVDQPLQRVLRHLAGRGVHLGDEPHPVAAHREDEQRPVGLEVGVHATPRLANSQAATSPTGPAPTTNTSVSMRVLPES
jgi:hypothetical protein